MPLTAHSVGSQLEDSRTQFTQYQISTSEFLQLQRERPWARHNLKFILPTADLPPCLHSKFLLRSSRVGTPPLRLNSTHLIVTLTNLLQISKPHTQTTRAPFNKSPKKLEISSKRLKNTSTHALLTIITLPPYHCMNQHDVVEANSCPVHSHLGNSPP